MAENKRVELVKDGYTASVPADDKVEINQLKARGFTVKEPKATSSASTSSTSTSRFAS